MDPNGPFALEPERAGKRVGSRLAMPLETSRATRPIQPLLGVHVVPARAASKMVAAYHPKKRRANGAQPRAAGRGERGLVPLFRTAVVRVPVFIVLAIVPHGQVRYSDRVHKNHSDASPDKKWKRGYVQKVLHHGDTEGTEKRGLGWMMERIESAMEESYHLQEVCLSGC